MADDLELSPASGGGSKLKLILLIVGVFLVAVGGTVGGLFAMGLLPPERAAESGEEVAEPEVREDAVYVALDPAFTVNFGAETEVRYLQLTLQAMTRDPAVEAEIKRHMPVIRNDLMLLFASQDAARLRTREGKVELQAETLAGIQAILERETGSPGVDAVYFTSFVMQ